MMKSKQKYWLIGVLVLVIVGVIIFVSTQQETNLRTNEIKSIPKPVGIICPKVHEEMSHCEIIDGKCYCHYWAAWGCKKDSDCAVPKHGIYRCTNIKMMKEEEIKGGFYDIECYCFKNSFCYEKNIEGINPKK